MNFHSVTAVAPIRPRIEVDDHLAPTTRAPGRKPSAEIAIKIDAYELRLRVEGATIPVWAHDEGEIAWTVLADRIGVRAMTLRAKHLGHRRRIEEWATIFKREPVPGPEAAILTPADFADIVLLQYRRDLESSAFGNSDQACAATRLRIWLDQFRAETYEHVNMLEFLAREDLDITSNREGEICVNYVRKWQRNENLPDNPTHLLRYAVARARTTQTILAKKSGVSQVNISGWMRGSIPQRGMEDDLRLLEAKLRLPENCLVDGFSQLRFRGAQSLRTPTQYGSETKLRQKLKYYYRDWSEDLEDEFADWKEYRTASILPYRTFRTGGPWRPQTLHMIRNYFCMLFGTWCSDLNRSVRMEPSACSLGYLVFPRLVHNRLEFIKERMEQVKAAIARDAAGDEEDGDHRFITRWEYDRLDTLRELLHEESGWIAQRPKLADRLKPVLSPNGEIVISQAEIDAAKLNWLAACHAARKEIGKFRKQYRKNVKLSRDPHEDVLPILQMENPFVALDMLCSGLAQDLSQKMAHTAERAYALRDSVCAGVEAQTALRVTTLSSLDLSHLIWDAAKGSYTLRIPRRLFKNPDGPYFWPNREVRPVEHYVRELEDQYGLYDAIREYLDWGRSHILQDGTSQALLVCEPKHRIKGARQSPYRAEPGRANQAYLNKLFHSLTDQYLGYEPDTGAGIPGIAHFGPHAFRHIVATGTLKNTTDPAKQLQAAADAIHDGIHAVKGYLRFLPADRDDVRREAQASGFAKARLARLAA